VGATIAIVRTTLNVLSGILSDSSVVDNDKGLPFYGYNSIL